MASYASPLISPFVNKSFKQAVLGRINKAYLLVVEISSPVDVTLILLLFYLTL